MVAMADAARTVASAPRDEAALLSMQDLLALVLVVLRAGHVSAGAALALNLSLGLNLVLWFALNLLALTVTVMQILAHHEPD